MEWCSVGHTSTVGGSEGMFFFDRRRSMHGAARMQLSDANVLDALSPNYAVSHYLYPETPWKSRISPDMDVVVTWSNSGAMPQFMETTTSLQPHTRINHQWNQKSERDDVYDFWTSCDRSVEVVPQKLEYLGWRWW